MGSIFRLHIYYIVSSWDCPRNEILQVSCCSGDTLQLKVSFPVGQGVFVREFHIYGNFPFAIWSDGGGRLHIKAKLIAYKERINRIICFIEGLLLTLLYHRNMDEKHKLIYTNEQNARKFF